MTNITTNYRQNPFFTTVLSTFSTSIQEYSKVHTVQVYMYLVQTFILSVLTCMVCVVCCMCRRENSDTTNLYNSTEYIRVPSSISDSIDSQNNEYGSTVYQPSRVYSPIQSSSVEPEPILEPQPRPQPEPMTNRIRRIHRTPRKPIPSKHTFAKSIEDLEFMV